MSWRRHVAALVFACGVGLPARAVCAGLAELPSDRQQLARCMLSVLADVPEAANSRLSVSDGPTPRVTFTYDYRRRTGAIMHNAVDITALLSNKRNMTIVLGGASTIRNDLDDVDLGMLRIASLWRSKCGLDLIAVTS